MPNTLNKSDFRALLADTERKHRNTQAYLEHYITSARKKFNIGTKLQSLKLEGLGSRVYPSIKSFGEGHDPIPLDAIRDNAAVLVERTNIIGGYSKIPRWKEGIDYRVKLILAHAALIRHGCYIPFNVHLSESLSRKIEANPEKAQTMLRHRFRDGFRRYNRFKNFRPEYYWVVEPSIERSKTKKQPLLHIHGALTVPARTTDIIEEVKHILSGIGGAEYSSGKSNDQVCISQTTHYMPGHWLEHKGEIDWSDYLSKHQTKPKQRQNLYASTITNNLKNTAKALYSAYRSNLLSQKIDNNIKDAVEELADWALEDIRHHTRTTSLPEDTELFQTIVRLLKLEGLEEIKQVIKSNRASLKKLGINFIDKKRSHSGAASLRFKVRNGSSKPKKYYSH